MNGEPSVSNGSSEKREGTVRWQFGMQALFALTLLVALLSSVVWYTEDWLFPAMFGLACGIVGFFPLLLIVLLSSPSRKGQLRPQDNRGLRNAFFVWAMLWVAFLAIVLIKMMTELGLTL